MIVYFEQPYGKLGRPRISLRSWIWLQCEVGSVLQLAEKLKSAANEERELSTAETFVSKLVAYDSIEVVHVQSLARTLLADSIALIPELDILDLPEEPPRIDQEELQSLWASFEKHFLAENGEVRLRYKKFSKFPLSNLVQDESILVGTTKLVMDAELRQNLSEDATQAWKVYVALRSVLASGLLAVLLDGKLAIVSSIVAGNDGEICSVPGLPMP
ncbi:hypothetical protein DL95DRAFT_400504 [Leptodontidium sp. 2 PMI_412]|nr:hypothetical protein DL95DRAFT_400504 [Leptodontidium sp. 2 PMI_412]